MYGRLKIGGASLAMLAVYVFLSPGRAVAACAARPPELVWSYPSTGATDVPTDAVFFPLSSGVVMRVELNGVQLARRHFGPGLDTLLGYDLGGLAPNEQYTLTIVLANAPGEQEHSTSVAFETGVGLYAGPAPAAEILGISGTDDIQHFSPVCQSVVGAQDCYDEGQDTHVLLAVTADALLFRVARRHPGSSDFMSPVLWPASCGAPSVFFYAEADACYTVYAFDPTGRVASSNELCGSAAGPSTHDGDPNSPKGSTDGASGCSLSTRSASSGMLLPLGLLLLALGCRKAGVPTKG